MADEEVNLLDLTAGTKLRLTSGATVEVVRSLGDGYWVEVKYLSAPEDPSLEGTQDSVFAAEVVEIV
ncbi:MAG: hypothetical protein OXL97_08855 [Chloroflexota bacterium]|nr:hypothetical protein [Chloroflexota bacterium]MDE2885460.1 hypothetical protein [Chloroflexota bacterium]